MKDTAYEQMKPVHEYSTLSQNHHPLPNWSTEEMDMLKRRARATNKPG